MEHPSPDATPIPDDIAHLDLDPHCTISGCTAPATVAYHAHPSCVMLCCQRHADTALHHHQQHVTGAHPGILGCAEHRVPLVDPPRIERL